LNEYRKKIVHYFTIRSQFLNKYSSEKFDRMQNAQEFNEIVKALFDNNQKTIEGFKYAIDLIKEKPVTN
jgi:hypothetical protein